MTTRLLYLFLISTFALAATAERPRIDLSGEWKVRLGSKNAESHSITLPGTLDEALIGEPNKDYTETTQLSRKVTYTGPAFYTRSFYVPESWAGHHTLLTLERTRPTTVWIDDQEIGSSTLISSAQRYELGQLSPGQHHITVMVDNGERIPAQVKSNSHACCESTQTNWNGILGRIDFQAVKPTHISSLTCRPLPGHCIEVTARVAHPADGLKMTISSGLNSSTLKLKHGTSIYTAILQLGDTARTWSEWQPARHRVTAKIPDQDELSTYAALRDFKAKNRHFYINDTLTFLRGRHDACVFPLTGYPPMDVDGWRQYFQTIKSYGLNHVRFHSWCPPEACFEAADIEGIYLQPELTIWGTFNRSEDFLMDFLRTDGQQILKAYRNHPSFVMFSLGNELWGEEDLMDEFVTDLRTIAPEMLYAYGSNAYLGYKGAQPGEDFFVTCRVGAGEGYDGYSSHARASFSFADAADGGILNHEYPNSVTTFEKAILQAHIPVIGHETGQYQSMPDFREIDKYTGVLEPRNLVIFKSRMDSANLLDQAEDFFNASSRWAAKLYKADMEMNLRTPQMAGFQLLDLQDYPGQGTALVGVLDAFMDSKGAISPKEWRQSCDKVVLLGEFPQFCYQGGQNIQGRISVANYSGKDLAGRALRWRFIDDEGLPVYGDTHRIPTGQGYVRVDTISMRAPAMAYPYKIQLQLELLGMPVDNIYDFWVYPEHQEFADSIQGIIISETMEDALTALNKGEKVLLLPRHEDVEGATVGGLFTTDYWNYRMFSTISHNANKPVSPGTMGLLIQAEHPALSQFPTDFHSDWQWFIPAKMGYPLVLVALNPEGYIPIVQAIDNVERNHRLGLVMEFGVGPGKLMLLMAPLSALNEKPEGRQLIASLIDYMAGPSFAPATTLSPDALRSLLTGQASSIAVRELRNISYD